MPTYATQADCEAYISGLVVEDPDAFARTIEEAERNVDVLLRARGWRNTDTGLMINPTELQPYQQRALARATAAQVEFQMSDGFGEASSGVKAASGPDFSVTYADRAGGDVAQVGPSVARELRSGGLLSAWARVR